MRNKFKAYDSFTKKIYPVIDISYTEEGEVDGVGFIYEDDSFMKLGMVGIYRDSEFIKDHPVVLLPYIGLVDIHGDEIYFGDIVKWEEKSKCCGKVIYTYIGCIDWLEDGAMYIRRIALEDDHWVGFGNWYNDGVVRLGNKYQDVELYDKEFIPF